MRKFLLISILAVVACVAFGNVALDRGGVAAVSIAVSNGLGGFEAIVPGPELFCPIVSDARGNLLAVNDPKHGGLLWNASRPTGYGAVPGYRPPPLGHGRSLVESSGWGGRWMSIVGGYHIGVRTLVADIGEWASADPAGHRSSDNLMPYADGDPINRDDPNGMLGKIAWNTAVGTASDIAHMIGNLDALGNPSNPRYSEVNLQLAMQGAIDYNNGGEGWGGLKNAFNRYNPERPAFEAFSGMHMVEGPQLGEPLTGEEKAVAWANTISLGASVGAGLPGTMRAFSAEALGAGGRAVVAGAAESGESSFLQNYLNGSGGRWGDSATRAFNDQIATQLEDQSLNVLKGAGRDSEQWIPGPNGGTTGGTWFDITAQAKDGTITRVQTVDTLADGVTPTAREAAAAARIRAAYPNDQLILIPKPK